MQIAILLFDGVTALDAVGPYEVLRLLPGADVRLVARAPGEQATDGGPLRLVADHALAEVPSPEIVVVPGGPGARALFEDRAVLGWLRSVHERSRRGQRRPSFPPAKAVVSLDRSRARGSGAHPARGRRRVADVLGRSQRCDSRDGGRDAEEAERSVRFPSGRWRDDTAVARREESLAEVLVGRPRAPVGARRLESDRAEPLLARQVGDILDSHLEAPQVAR